MTTGEQRNFLSQCWRRNRWAEGLGDLMLPVRRSVWRLRRRQRHAEAARAATPAPELSPEIHRLFSDTAGAPGGLASEVLFAEIDLQLEGVYRLAGGRSTRLYAGALENLPDPEDRH